MTAKIGPTTAQSDDLRPYTAQLEAHGGVDRGAQPIWVHNPTRDGVTAQPAFAELRDGHEPVLRGEQLHDLRPTIH